MDGERRVRAEGDGPHEVGRHAERPLAVGARVEEGQVPVVDEDGWSASAKISILFLQSQEKCFHY